MATMNSTNNTQPPADRLKIPCTELPDQMLDPWWMLKFLLSSALAPFGIFILVVAYGRWISLRKKFTGPQNVAHEPDGSSHAVPDSLNRTVERPRDLLGELQIRAQNLTSTTNIWAQILNLLVFFASMIVYVIYLFEVSNRNTACLCILGLSGELLLGSIFEDNVAMLELGLHCFFIIHFLVRFTASHQKLWFILDPYTIVDYLTIPPAFVSICLNLSWTGFRFVRILHLFSVPDFLQYIGTLRNRTEMRFCQLICTSLSVLLAAAGLFHLLENSTDLFNEADVIREKALSYWEYVYFCIVTAGTVGYGDIKCITSQGRIFNAIFIIFTLAVVASILPDIFRIIANRKKYGGHYSEHGGKKHIVVCGNINFISAGGFLKEFLHKDRGSCDIKVIFMDLREPDIEMEGLLKRHFTDVEYLQGSAMHSHDLKRAKAEGCEACIIAANKYCIDPDAEDAANIMRVISIKNYHSSTRVIVELMQYHNKAYLLNIPSWNWKSGDEVVCLAELKLGLIAQSCIAPGFSTLMANLFTSRSFSTNDKTTSIDSYGGWKSEYLRGTGMEMYSEILSQAFVGLTFAEAAEICLLKLDILLIAVSFWDPGVDDYAMDINPKPSLAIEPRTQGFFIADSAGDVQRAASYCGLCHVNIHRIEMIKKCGCRPFTNNNRKMPIQVMSKPSSPKFSEKAGRRMSVMQGKTKEEKVEIFIQNYPSTPTMKRAYELLEPHPGTYLVVPLQNKYKSLSESSNDSGGDVSLHPSEPDPELAALNEQIENCKFDSTGMFHWCAPRPFESALIDRYAAAKKQFYGHVVVGIFADANSPLIGLNSLVMPLRSSNFGYAELKQIVFLGNIDYLSREWKNLYNFPKITIIKGTALSRADLRALSIHSCSMCVILTAKVPHTNDSNLTDKEVIMASLNIKAMDCEPRVTSVASRPVSTGPVSGRGSQVFQVPKKHRSGTRIPMITDLFNDPNVQFLDPDDDDDDPDTGFFATEPFACGTAFTASVLDSLMSMVYFNPSAFRVIRALIFGGASSELEEILAEGAGLIGGAQLSDPDNRNRSYITQIRLTDALFVEYANQTFGELFVRVLYKYGILCLGIFRLFAEHPAGSPSKRYVITKPAPNNRLRESDYIFALMQSDFGAATKEVAINNNST
ncbi:Calcium-activated potassium channel slo-1 [Hypsibius exemplaris]|uniref:BK channel n=1 Tax=Hypsibius exemplaris TaxID=2072580 RepID=A0A1W0X8K7_HYPEX|nr:Calcium-activated potassium channel slo-1 [Hypsibius exemplaris]